MGTLSKSPSCFANIWLQLMRPHLWIRKDFNHETPRYLWLLFSLPKKMFSAYSGWAPRFTPSGRILKEAIQDLVGPFYTLFNHSHNFGSLPQSWKITHITPIFKSGDHFSPTSYQLISLTSIPCKIFECIIKIQILNHLARNNLIATEQHGFLSGKLCITNLPLFMDSMTQACDSGPITDSIFWFRKSFWQSLTPTANPQTPTIQNEWKRSEELPDSSGIHSIELISDTLRCSAGLCSRLTHSHDLHTWSPIKYSQPVAPVRRWL